MSLCYMYPCKGLVCYHWLLTSFTSECVKGSLVGISDPCVALSCATTMYPDSSLGLSTVHYQRFHRYTGYLQWLLIGEWECGAQPRQDLVIGFVTFV
jgi:hypothetical protein